METKNTSDTAEPYVDAEAHAEHLKEIRHPPSKEQKKENAQKKKNKKKGLGKKKKKGGQS